MMDEDTYQAELVALSVFQQMHVSGRAEPTATEFFTVPKEESSRIKRLTGILLM